MQNWEYKTITHYWNTNTANMFWSDRSGVANGADAVERRLNEESADGWELVSYEEMNQFPPKTHYHLERAIS